jgi:hypothetical protein
MEHDTTEAQDRIIDLDEVGEAGEGVAPDDPWVDDVMAALAFVAESYPEILSEDGRRMLIHDPARIRERVVDRLAQLRRQEALAELRAMNLWE